MSADRAALEALAARVALLEDELDAAERAIEWLRSDSRNYRYGLGGLLQAVYSRDERGRYLNGFAQQVHEALYPESIGALEHIAGPAHPWSRPARRFARHGSRAQLLAWAREHGLDVRATASRETIVRAFEAAGIPIGAPSSAGAEAVA